MQRISATSWVIAMALLAGCGSSGPTEPPPFSDSNKDGGSGNRPGDAGDDGGLIFANDGSTPGSDGGAFVPGVLMATIHDFKVYSASDSTTVPDFENPPFDIGQDGNPSPGYRGSWYDTEIVADALGADGTPDYKHPTATKTLTTHGADAFHKWYHDTPGTNLTVQYPLNLHDRGNGIYGYDSDVDGVPYNLPGATGGGFFPIDDGSPYQTAFGNQGFPHNYSFTMEIHTIFTYRGGEYFQFRGDDDVFVFINKKLVINLGGVHDPEEAQVGVDTLGLTVGQTYPLDFFSAERHVYGSNIKFTTTITLRSPPK